MNTSHVFRIVLLSLLPIWYAKPCGFDEHMSTHMFITMHTQMKQFARVQAKDALKFSQPSSPAGLSEMNGDFGHFRHDLRPKWSCWQLIIAISFTAWADVDPNRLLVMETSGEIEETMATNCGWSDGEDPPRTWRDGLNKDSQMCRDSFAKGREINRRYNIYIWIIYM